MSFLGGGKQDTPKLKPDKDALQAQQDAAAKLRRSRGYQGTLIGSSMAQGGGALKQQLGA
jgi:hypothetical protein